MLILISALSTLKVYLPSLLKNFVKGEGNKLAKHIKKDLIIFNTMLQKISKIWNEEKLHDRKILGEIVLELLLLQYNL